MSKFRKKPVVIEAMQLDKTNSSGIRDWAHKGMHPAQNSIIIINRGGLEIRTLEGTMQAIEGDWVIKGVNNEFYPCKPDIFEKTYEPVLEVN